MTRIAVRIAATLVLVAACASAGTPPHPKPAAKGHPRLFVTKETLSAARERLARAGTPGKAILDATVARVPPAGTIDYVQTLHATAPMAALLLDSEEGRKAMAENAVATALAIAKRWDPPYPDEPEWIEWFLYRYLAIAYDACFDAMTEEQRAEIRDDLVKAAALAAAFGVETTANNHWTVAAVDLGLIALALEGDVPETPTRYEDVRVIRAAFTKAGDFLPHRSGFRIERVGLAPGKSDFVEGKDFDVSWIKDSDAGYAIVWKAGGKGPPEKAEYRVTYSFTPEIATWRELARRAIAWNLDHVWGDGASLAGVMYGSFTLWWMADLFEAFGLNGGPDFGEHPNVTRIPWWLASEALPGDGLRTNARNDSTIEGAIDGLCRAGPYLAWATSYYRGRGADLPGVAEVARAVWRRGTAWPQTAAWREALWLDDDPAPNPTAAPPVVGGSAFFRGHDLSNFRAGDWDRPDTWALLSVTSGPLSLAEHDQTDKGSFTFHALGQDFAIDSGYAQGDPKSDSTAAHNYVLIDGKGQPGAWASCARARAHFIGGAVEGVHCDLTKSWANYGAWSRHEAKGDWPVARADRYVVLLKDADLPPIAVIADSMDVDRKPHDFDFLLHTKAGNEIVLPAKGTTVLVQTPDGGPRLVVPFAAADTPSFSQDAWQPRDGPSHPRLLARVKALDPGFLAALIPDSGDPKEAVRIGRVPLANSSAIRLLVLERGGKKDVIAAASREVAKVALAEFSSGEIETDAGLAVVRLDPAGNVASWLALDATRLSWKGRVLWSLETPKGTRGSAAFDGKSLAVEAPDATRFSAWAPEATGFHAEGRPLALSGSGAAGTVVWLRKRALRDTFPKGVPAREDDFANAATPWWFVWPAKGVGFTRVENGEMCCPGLRHEWLSWTRRNYNDNPFQSSGPPRADVFSYPRSDFGDVVLTGTLSVVEARPGATLSIAVRVSDRSYPKDGVDQDLVQAILDPAKKEVALVARVEGKAIPLAKGSGVVLPVGTNVTFELSVQGDAVAFSLDGAVRARATSKRLPARGYCQWEIAEGMHVHLDDVKAYVEK